jgi:(p)ppGpp synthase/HD superfamily hydrolase
MSDDTTIPVPWVPVEDRLNEVLGLIRRAKELAMKAHQEDRREDGQPYITHVQAVASAVTNAEAVVVAWLHDVVEDHPEYEHDVKSFPQWVYDAVMAVSRKGRNEPYVDYLRRVLANKLATEVKIADLRHNLSDQKPGNRKDKYDLTLQLLRYPEITQRLLDSV